MPQAYALVNKGTSASGTSVTPGNPASVVAGRLLLWANVCRNNADTFTAPSGWTELHPHVNVTFCSLFARIATATSGDNAVAIASSGSNAIISQIAQFSGNVWQGGLGSIVDSSIDKTVGTNAGILYSQLNAPSVIETLVIGMGCHNKTVTSNGATVTTLSGMTDIDQLTGSGTQMEFWWGYQQQTAAAIVASGGATQAISISETLQYASLLIALKTQPVAGSALGAAAAYASRRRK